ncbi:hypothetical protein [Noviluteimonas gilva]|uniref:Uncharacterized protein n=1 Tax=Noviluteimonas gilva TaxID=2682097 RepID=A0A7C9HYW3_9GAMM|nr:hypothetical protein [Lysobacter gilvus]MUV14474.1 hypothetical protein [Lysobacter gilvus]
MIAPILVEHDAQGHAFKVRFEQHHGYLRAYVHEGRDSLEVSTAMWHLLGQHCRTHGATRLLVVEDLDGTVPLEQIDDVIAAMADAGFAAIRTAFVELQDDLQGSEHGSILASERGVNVYVTNDEFVARHWLMYGE